MFVIIRAVTYATLSIGFFLVYMPARVLLWSGIVRPEIGVQQLSGMVVGAMGAMIALVYFHFRICR